LTFSLTIFIRLNVLRSLTHLWFLDLRRS